MSDAPLALVPPRRLGSLLHDTRVARGVGVDGLAAQSFFTVKDLEAIEAGDRNLTDRELMEVLGVYHVEVDDLFPARTYLVIDLDEQRVTAGGRQRSVAGQSPTPDQVLASYLSLVYALRHVEPGTPLILRASDLDVLARVLELSTETVTARLHTLMVDPDVEVRRRSRLLRGRALVPLVGVVLAATAIGTILLVQNDGGQRVTTEPAGAPEPAFVMPNEDGSTTPVYIGEGLDPDDLPPGAVALAPATQQSAEATTVVRAEGVPVPADLPVGEVWVGDPQVAERDDDGTVTQSTRQP